MCVSMTRTSSADAVPRAASRSAAISRACDVIADCTRGRALGEDPKRQCDISTGTVIACSIVRVTPPRISSRMRVWPYPPMTIRSLPRSAARDSSHSPAVTSPAA